MATVTGLTKDRMLEIEAASIVDGDVVGGNLILTKHDGTTIDAGPVIGPEGPTGPEGPSAPQDTAATPSTLALRNTAGTFSVADPLVGSNPATKSYVDLLDSQQKTYVDNADTSINTKLNDLTTRYKGTELGANVDLDTLITPGIYTQTTNVEASTSLHYPEASAGLLEVFVNDGGAGAPSMVWQRYTIYGPYSSKFFTRGKYNGSWSGWYQHGTTGWVDISSSLGSSFLPYSTSFPAMKYNRVGNMVNLAGVIKPATAAAATAIDGTGGAVIVDLGPLGLTPSWIYAIHTVQHGSGEDIWQMAGSGSQITAARYGPGVPNTSSWMPFSVTYAL